MADEAAGSPFVFEVDVVELVALVASEPEEWGPALHVRAFCLLHTARLAQQGVAHAF